MVKALQGVYIEDMPDDLFIGYFSKCLFDPVHGKQDCHGKGRQKEG